MPLTLRANWWALLLRGIVAILIALVTFAIPGLTISVLAILFGIYALVDGVLAIISAIRAAKGHSHWGAFLVEGIVGIAIGILAMIAPGLVVISFVTVLGVWAFLTGILEIVAAIRLRRHIRGEWVLAGIGVLSIVFGILLFLAPFAGAVFFAWWFAAYELFFGILLITLSFRVRKLTAGPAPAPQLQT